MSNKTKSLSKETRGLNRANWLAARAVTPTITAVPAPDYEGFVLAGKITNEHRNWPLKKVKDEVKRLIESKPERPQKGTPAYVTRFGIVRAGRFMRANKKRISHILCKGGRLPEDSPTRKMLMEHLPWFFKRQIQVERVITERHARTPLRSCIPYKQRTVAV